MTDREQQPFPNLSPQRIVTTSTSPHRTGTGAVSPPTHSPRGSATNGSPLIIRRRDREDTPFMITGKEDSILWAWGQNSLGRLGFGNASDSADTTSEENDGIWNAHDKPTPVPFDSKVAFVRVAAGASHSLALSADGNFYSWGSGSSNQLGHPAVVQPVPKQVDLGKVSHIDAGNQHSIALKDDGTVIYQLGRKFVQPQLKEKSVKFVVIAAGNWHSMALSDSGEVYSWGQNEYGQLGNNSIGTGEIRPKPVVMHNDDEKSIKFVAIAAGARHSIAISNTGQLYTWGAGGYGQLGHGDISQQLVPKRVHMPNIKFTQADGGTWHSVALTDTGDVYTWGAGGYGQLGHLPKENLESLCLVPTKVVFQTPTIVAKIAAGDNFTLALTRDGKIWAWGSNNAGQLGFKTKKTKSGKISTSPQLIQVDDHVRFFDISAGSAHVLALRIVPDQLQDDLKSILKSGLFWDCEFVHNGVALHLHKIIMNDRCPQLLKTDLSKFSIKTVQLLIAYLYTNEVDTTIADVAELKQLASCAAALSLPELKSWCEQYEMSLTREDFQIVRNRIVPSSASMRKTLKKAFSESSDYDFQLILESAEATPLGCHRVILATRCEFFAAAFRSKMAEVSKGQMKLSGLPHTFPIATFKMLLEYLYTDKYAHVTLVDHALAIFANAGFFGLNLHHKHRRMLSHCTEIIARSMNVDNCLEILKTIHVVGPSNELKTRVIQFIVQKYRKVAENEELAALPHHLFQEINVAFNLMMLDRLGELTISQSGSSSSSTDS